MTLPTSNGRELVLTTVVNAVRPDPVLHVDVWSEKHMVLPRSTSEPGPYRLDRTPYARRVLQVLSPTHPCKRVAVRGASQMLKTQTAINWICASIHLAPANILALEPTDKLAKRLSARIATAITDVDVVRDAVAQPRSRDSRNTIDAKDFQGGTLYITTAGAAANLAEIPARYVFLDEVDRMEQSIDGEGDPVELAEARATTFQSNCKFYEVSSPTTVGVSKIDALHAMGTKEVYLVPCPHCGHHQELLLENFHYERDLETGHMARAWFVCPDCGAEIDERYKGQMFRDEALGGTAHWHATAPGDGETVSFSISAFYAKPGDITWLSLARQYARAKDRQEKGDPQAMQVFYNTRLALSFDNTESTSSVQQLMARAEDYAPRTVPEAALVLTASVDTQPNRLEVQIEAWGPGLERWIVDHIVLNGDPSEPPSQPGSVWARLDEIRRTPLPHASGVLIMISAYGIDSGGSNTQDVYNYGQSRQKMGCLIFKGSSRPNRPIISSVPTKVDIDWGGSKVEGGALMWSLGTDVAKDHIHNRLALTDGPGAIHFHKQLTQDWFEQLLSERRQIRYVKGHARVAWVKAPGDRNEVLDMTVYNLAVAYSLGLYKWSNEDWRRLRAKLIPAQVTQDLFVHAHPQPAPNVDALAKAPVLPAETPVLPAETVPKAQQTPNLSALPAPASTARRQLNRGIQ